MNHRAVSILSIRLTALGLLAALPTSGCGAEPPASQDAPTAEAMGALQTCVAITRGGAGNVADAKLRADQPTTNLGAEATFVTGNHSTNRIDLMRFDLSPIPAGQLISSATVTLNEIQNLGPSTIDVHLATSAWVENTVTWSSFGSAYDPAVMTSFDNGGAGHTGPVSFDIASAVKSWYSGATNNGLALVAATNSTWSSSEAASPSARPTLQVCYTPDLCLGVVCAASDQCHAAGVCDPATGACSNAPKPDGTPCDDGDPCTQDTCQGGVCAGFPICNTTPLSCLDMHTKNPGAPSGVYSIDPDGPGPGAPMSVYCDMVNDGGGWMLVTPAMINSQSSSTVAVNMSTDPLGGLAMRVYLTSTQCAPWNKHVVLFNDVIPWTKLRASYTFGGGSPCWAIFGDEAAQHGQQVPQGGVFNNLIPFDKNIDVIRNEVKMGGSNGDAFDGITYRCDNTSTNFWRLANGSNGYGSGQRSAQVILRRASASKLAGLATTTACASGSWAADWHYSDIYVR